MELSSAAIVKVKMPGRVECWKVRTKAYRSREEGTEHVRRFRECPWVHTVYKYYSSFNMWRLWSLETAAAAHIHGRASREV